LDAGRICADATPLELKNRYTGDYITFYGVSEEELKAAGIAAERVGEALRAEVKDTAEATALVLKHPELFRDYEITKGRMDDVFLNVTGKTIER
ncbi:MAG: ABC transporter, partial [Clostridia bacterium]|nr:ABC transporter [Clostridia bacterium]